VQVEFNQINVVIKEINITIPSDEVTKAYEKYLVKIAKEIEVPGFRKGKAPLYMVERVNTEKIKENFCYDYVIDVFDKVAEENHIEYLLYPDIKDLQWEKGNDMTVKIQIEHEPQLELKQIEGLTVPYKPAILEESVEKFIADLIAQNTIIKDVEIAEENDEVEVELIVQNNSDTYTVSAIFYAGSEDNDYSIPSLIGHKIGDTLSVILTGKKIQTNALNADFNLVDDTEYSCELCINRISRKEIPALDDEFAKDMEYDSLEEMRAKIAEEMKLRIEHINIDIENNSIINKLFTDNPFPLPMKTVEYLAFQQISDVSDDNLRKLLLNRYYYMIMNQMVQLYIGNALMKEKPIELTDEMVEEYINHQAIIQDVTVEAYKEHSKIDFSSQDTQNSIKEYFILRQIAKTCEFVIEKEPPETENTESGTEKIEEE